MNDEKMGIFMIEKVANNPSRLDLKRVDEIVETLQAESDRASTHRISSVLAVNVVILIAIATRTCARNGQIWQISEIAAHRDRIGVDAKLQLASIGRLECHKLAERLHAFDHVLEELERGHLNAQRGPTNVRFAELVE